MTTQINPYPIGFLGISTAMTDAQAASLINIDLGSATALTIPNVPSGGRGTGSVTVTAGSNSFILINNTLEIEDFVERFPAENRNATTVGSAALKRQPGRHGFEALLTVQASSVSNSAMGNLVAGYSRFPRLLMIELSSNWRLTALVGVHDIDRVPAAGSESLLAWQVLLRNASNRPPYWNVF